MTERNRDIVRRRQSDQLAVAVPDEIQWGDKPPSRNAEKSNGKLVLPKWDKDRDLYPLNAPDMPTPGSDFVDMAEALGDTKTEFSGKGYKRSLVSAGEILIDLHKRALYSTGDFSLRTTIKGDRKIPLRVVSGHKWRKNASGPVRSDVMVIGKMLGKEEVSQRRNYVGPTGQYLDDVASQFASDSDLREWYMTNLIKTGHPEGYGNSTLKKSWINQWLPILHQELRFVRPKVIICLGAEASKALLGKQATVTWMEGRVVEYRFPISRKHEKDLRYHTSLVMTILHPAAVLHAPEQEDKFISGVARAVQLASGQRWDKEEEGLDHRLVETLPQLRELAAEINRDVEDNLIGVDAEWHGQHPQNKGAYVRSFQVSWKRKTAASITFRDVDGNKKYTPKEMKEVLRLLRKICRGKQISGHFLDADMEFLTPFGLDLREQYRVPDTWQQYMKDMLQGKPCGFDTGLAAHSLNETDDFSLTSQSLRYTTAPRYDIRLVEWKRSYCHKHGLKDKELEGYGPCPDEVLFGEKMSNGKLRFSYGCYDADVARRLAVRRIKDLCKDGYGNNCWEAMWMSMRAMPVVLEINTTGLLIDKQRVDDLTETYMTARAQLEQKIRDWARWPDFNLNSVFQVREFLFGERYNGKRPEPGKSCIRLRPEKARSLKLEPILSTDKRPIEWKEVVANNQEDEKTASTNKTTLAILAQENQEVRRYQPRKKKVVTFDFSKHVNWIRDYRFISQVLKSSLRPPIIDDGGEGESAVYRKDEDGFYVYAGGLASAICSDGRIRTHVYPTLETRRWASARPPLQNLSKRREADYKRILQQAYKSVLRSIVVASPGKVLVEADFVGAELFGMGIMSGDPLLIDHATRNGLAEDDPEFYDIHSNVAKLAFGLECAATKAGLKSLGMAHMRIVAKSVIFGIAYGRGAKAIALAAKEEGVIITVDEAQQVVDTIFRMYPELQPFFDSCKRRSRQERWICGCFGGFRRFPVAREQKTEGEFERQAMNFPIQGMIADAMARAVDQVDTYRRDEIEPGDDFWFDVVLQIHDALLFEVEYQHVPRLIDEVIPQCMSKRVPIYPCHLDGRPKHDPNAPYFLGVDIEVADHWGELMYPNMLIDRRIDPKYGGWSKYKDGWKHINEKDDSYWRDGIGWTVIAV